MVPVALQQRPARHPKTRPSTPIEPTNAGSPLERGDFLARLRDRSALRPSFDPNLPGGLRAWLEDGASALVATRGDDAPPMFLGPRLLLGQPGATASARQAGNLPSQLVLSSLVHALFTQLVTIGSIDDPLTDALDALSLHPNKLDLVHHINGLDRRARSALEADLACHVAHLTSLTPAFLPGWLPRTDDRVAIALAGGRVILGGVFDLLVGAPMPGQASVCAVQLTSGGPWAFARAALHYLALLETLRNGSPPYRLALLDSSVGRYATEDIQEEHIRAMAAHVVTRLTNLGGHHE